MLTVGIDSSDNKETFCSIGALVFNTDDSARRVSAENLMPRSRT
jgi:hypothetical protein